MRSSRWKVLSTKQSLSYPLLWKESNRIRYRKDYWLEVLPVKLGSPYTSQDPSNEKTTFGNLIDKSALSPDNTSRRRRQLSKIELSPNWKKFLSKFYNLFSVANFELVSISDHRFVTFDTSWSVWIGRCTNHKKCREIMKHILLQYKRLIFYF